jgi:hypothetical protein
MSDQDTLEQEGQQSDPLDESQQKAADLENQASQPNQGSFGGGKFGNQGNAGGGNKGNQGKFGDKGNNQGPGGKGTQAKDKIKNKAKDFAKDQAKEQLKKQAARQTARAAAHAATDAETAGLSAAVIEGTAKAMDYRAGVQQAVTELKTEKLGEQLEKDKKPIYGILIAILLPVILLMILFMMWTTNLMGYFYTIQREEGLSITKTGPEQVGNNGEIAYTIVGNYTKQANDFIITEDIPDNAEFVTASGNFETISKDGKVIGVTWSAVRNNVASFVTRSGASCGNTSVPPAPPPLSCTGTSDEIHDAYYPTYFGCNTGFPDDPDDNCVPGCQNIPECTGVTGKACEETVKWYSANADQYGCNAVLKVTNPETGAAVIVRSIDQGPNCSVQTQGAKFDISQATNQALGNPQYVVVGEVDPSTPLGPVDCSLGQLTTLFTFTPLEVTVVLRPLDVDTFVINKATVELLGGTDPLAPAPGSPAGPPNCTNGVGPKCAFEYMIGPYTGFGRFTGRYPPLHEGVDLIVKANTPIRALESGVVVSIVVDSTGFSTGGGNSYKIRDKNNRYHLGLHMIRPSSYRAGQPINQGDVIGYVGHTGQNTSTTDHLHYQISNPQSSVASSGDWRNPEVVLANWPNY